VGTVAFQREHGAPLTLTDVMYVPGLKKNLVLVAMIKDKGYDVVFSKGKVFLRHIAMGQTKRIGIQVKNLYKLELDDCCNIEYERRIGAKPRHWRVVAQAVGPFSSWGFEDNATDIYRTSQR